MHKGSDGFTLVESLMVIAVLVIACVAGLYAYAQHEKRNTASQSSSSTLLLDMDNSGSTNTPPWDLYIYINGSGKIVYQNRNSSLGESGTNKSYPTATFNVSAMRQDLQQLNYSHLPTCTADYQQQLSSASVSFGGSIEVIYKGRHLDAFCANNKVENDLYNQLNKAYMLVNPA
jgi:prepilin-type N-terminal cleavage/methylation domain-containing protein